MTVNEMIKTLDLDIINLSNGEQNVKDCYISDLLSLVMSRAKDGDVWLSVQTNINIIAVAVLCNVSAIVVVEGMAIDENTILKAKSEEISLLRTNLTAYEMAKKLASCL